MNRRKGLLWMVCCLAAAGLVTALYPFAASLQPSARARNDAVIAVELPSLVPGRLHRVEVRGAWLFLLEPTAEHWTAIRALDGHVWDSSITTFNEKLGAFAFWGHSSRWGCLLDEVPPGAETVFIDGPPRQWLGGYWDWSCEVSYDYAGRAIRTAEFTRSGFNARLPNLAAPLVLKEGGGKLLVSPHGR